MKRFIPILSLVVLFASCEYEDYRDPYADFSIDYDLVVPGEVVSFTNFSEDATHYEWNFGDGARSTLRNPSHYFLNEGVYEVTLAAYNGNVIDYAYLTVEVYSTTLEIEVRDYISDELIPRLNVIVYPTYDDYFNFGREVFRGVTDYNGTTVAKDLNTQSYYIELYNDMYHNNQLAVDDINFIRTAPLSYAMHNVFITYVDYDPVTGRVNTERISIKESKIKSTSRTLENRKLSLK